MDNKKSTIFISAVSVVLFIIAIVAVSYAYYTSFVRQTGKNTIDVDTAKLNASFDDKETLTIANMIPGDSFDKTFSLINGPTVMKYKIVINELVNEFTKPKDITYVLFEDGVEIKRGTFPTTTNALSDEITIEPNQTKSYKLTITYEDAEHDQKDDMGKTISGKIFIEEV